jgi:hypothetical protein
VLVVRPVVLRTGLEAALAAKLEAIVSVTTGKAMIAVVA